MTFRSYVSSVAKTTALVGALAGVAVSIDLDLQAFDLDTLVDSLLPVASWAGGFAAAGYVLGALGGAATYRPIQEVNSLLKELDEPDRDYHSEMP
jgi:hypothetical protein